MARTGRPKKDKPTEEIKAVLVRMPAMLKLRLDADAKSTSLSDWIIDAIRQKLDGSTICLTPQPTQYLKQTTDPQSIGYGMPPMPAPPKFGVDVAAFLAKSKPSAPLIENLPVDEPEDPQEVWYHKCRDQFPQQTKQAELQSRQFKGKDQWGRMTWEQRYERLLAFRDAGDSGMGIMAAWNEGKPLMLNLRVATNGINGMKLKGPPIHDGDEFQTSVGPMYVINCVSDGDVHTFDLSPEKPNAS
jgi:hypothetical protein